MKTAAALAAFQMASNSMYRDIVPQATYNLANLLAQSAVTWRPLATPTGG